jgi:solute carrier family 35 (UDP-sugar transporter), member A1/2/3
MHALRFPSSSSLSRVLCVCFVALFRRLSFVESSQLISSNFFNNWDTKTLIPVTSNALGGVVVGLVTKYAGGVVKGFALIAGIIVTGFAQWFVENKQLTIEHWVAVVLVSISIYVHSSFPPAKKIEKKEEKKI